MRGVVTKRVLLFIIIKHTRMLKQNTAKPLLSGPLLDLPKCPLIEGVRLIEVCKNCAMFDMLSLDGYNIPLEKLTHL